MSDDLKKYLTGDIINEEYALKFAPVTKFIKENKITWYKLAEISTIPEGTLYAYRIGRYEIPDAKCALIADALELEITELFPDVELKVDLGVKKNSEEQSPTNPGSSQTQSEDEPQSTEESDMKIEMKDMMAGCQALYSEDGKTVKVNCVRTSDHVDFPGVTLDTVEQVIVKLGIKSTRFDTDRILFKLNKFLIENDELSADSAVFDFNGELCVLIRCIGTRSEMAHGKEIGHLVFI